MMLSYAAFGSVFETGFARVDITPELGVPLSGNFAYRPAEFIHDRLEATCIAFSDGTTTALVYTVDNLHITNYMIERSWNAIEKTTGVPRQRIFIASTHTHNAPETGETYKNPSPEADLVKANKLLERSNDMLESRLAEAGRLACLDVSSAKMLAAKGTCPGISFIRLFRMKSGGTRTNPGINNPDIDSPIGTPDESLQLVRIVREGKKDIAIVNFQTHPAVIGRRGISADWPGSARRCFEKAMDGKVLCAVFNGTSGDVNHINVHPTPGLETVSGYPHSLKMGRKVAAAALAVWDDCLPVSVTGKVEGCVRLVRSPSNMPSPEELAKARKIFSAHTEGRKDEIPFTGMEYTTVVSEARRMLSLENGPEFFELPVSTVAVGGALVFAGYPGEPFTELGRSLKRTSPFAVTIPCCTVNGSWGYFPTENVYAFGGYEARASNFKPGVGEILRDALKEDIARLYSEVTPVASKKNRGALCLSFDDCNFDAWKRHLPLFRKYAARVTFFINGAIDEKAQEFMRLAAAEGHSVGLHGVKHQKAVSRIKQLGEDRYFKDEIKPQLDVCREKGIEVNSFAYPFSARNSRTDALLLKYFKRLRGAGNGIVSSLEEVGSKRIFLGLGSLGLNNDADKITSMLSEVSSNNTVLVCYSHSICDASTSHSISAAELERILAEAKRIGVRVVGFDDLPVAGDEPAGDSFEAMRKKMLNRPRSVIWNTDGNDMVLYPRNLPLTQEAFESVRLKYSENTRIDSVFYCPHASAFGWFTTRKTHDFMTTQYRPPEAPVYNAAADFAAKDTDALEMASAFCRRNGMEIFVSIRMNDTHDNRGPKPPNAHFSLFKQQHPECLMGTMTNRPRYCAWTAVDFAQAPVRAHVRRFVREFLENYDVDGIEYDFFRHLQILKSVADGNDATEAELNMMTGFMRELKDIAEDVGRKRARPFLVAVRVPDSVGFCRTVGIDIERWMRERLVDIVIGSGYFQCNPWRISADNVHKYGCKFYASLDEPRNAKKRAPLGMLPGRSFSLEFYRARGAAAITDGADGVYYYNMEKQNLSSIAKLDYRNPAGETQNYFAVPRATAFSQFRHYCANADRFLNMPKIDPQQPLRLAAGGEYSFELVVGDDPSAYDPAREVTIRVLTDAKDDSGKAVSLRFNGEELKLLQCKNRIYTFSVPAASVKKGGNAVAVKAAVPVKIVDFLLRIQKAK